jgi:superfamily II DNA helicase RecQ
MTRIKSESNKKLLPVSGVEKNKLEVYGTRFLSTIREYVGEAG